MIQERVIRVANGWGMFFPLLAAFVGGVFAVPYGATVGSPAIAIAGGIVALVAFICFFGCKVVQPNLSRALVFFGNYEGTIKEPGFYWVNPFYSTHKVSLRIRNFETGVHDKPEVKDSQGHVTQHASRSRNLTKVNDRDGNPIEIAAVVVWKVVDTAAALFHVDDYEDFVKVQSESALRNLASQYHYDSEDDAAHSLRGNTTMVAAELQKELQERLGKAGVEVLEARIAYLAYAPEIAAAMLQRQQASAVIAARTKIVDGAVGMVEMALARLSANKVVELDPDRRAAMVSNLLVVLCGDRAPHPVVNTGTIY
ncbi:MAG TPA: SPFH domain-containing protein [Planctomycetia bacterium]|nr:SPFH domain-containing protein [Planctomycetia bacterium]